MTRYILLEKNEWKWKQEPDSIVIIIPKLPTRDDLRFLEKVIESENLSWEYHITKTLSKYTLFVKLFDTPNKPERNENSEE